MLYTIGWGGIACLATLITGEAWVFKRLMKNVAAKRKYRLTVGEGANTIHLA